MIALVAIGLVYAGLALFTAVQMRRAPKGREVPGIGFVRDDP